MRFTWLRSPTHRQTVTPTPLHHRPGPGTPRGRSPSTRSPRGPRSRAFASCTGEGFLRRSSRHTWPSETRIRTASSSARVDTGSAAAESPSRARYSAASLPVRAATAHHLYQGICRTSLHSRRLLPEPLLGVSRSTLYKHLPELGQRGESIRATETTRMQGICRDGFVEIFPLRTTSPGERVPTGRSC
jgi:hypothetical protein